jgi:hypothetical protein
VRSSTEIAERYEGTRLWVYEDAPEEQGVEPTDTFALDDELPGGVRAFVSGWENEVELWLPEQRALVTGDVILGAEGGGLRLLPHSWLPEGGSRSDVVAALAPLRELPVELVLPAHGEPVLENGAAALTEALDA